MWRHTIIIILHKAVVVLLRNSFFMLVYKYILYVCIHCNKLFSKCFFLCSSTFGSTTLKIFLFQYWVGSVVCQYMYRPDPGLRHSESYLIYDFIITMIIWRWRFTIKSRWLGWRIFKFCSINIRFSDSIIRGIVL